jgi:hypothetical protein
MHGSSTTTIVPSHEDARAVQDPDLPTHEPNARVRLNSDKTETEREDKLMKLKL